MKKLLTLALFVCGFMQVWAYEWTDSDGVTWTFNVSGSDATITESSQTTGNLVIPSKVYNGNTEYSVTSIGSSAFRNCTSLTSVTLPESLTSIGFNAFYGCSRLTSVTIPESVTSIGENAFNNTPFFNNQPDGLVYLGLVAYKYKGTIPAGTEIVIADGTVSISPSAFYQCKGLTGVTIPEGVTSIGSSAFEGCSGLTKVIVSDIASWCNIIFSNSDSNPLSYAKHIYSDDNTEITDLVIPDGVTSIGQWAFSGCTGLTGVTIPSSVTSIGERAFINCTGLASVTIPESVTSIGENAFNNTPFFNNQPDGLVYLGLVAYKYKGTIPAGTEIVIADGTVSISPSAFYGCSNLTSVTIPSSVTSIGGKAFYGCSRLTSVTISSNAIMSKKSSSVSSILKNIFGGQVKSYVIGEGVTSIGDYAFNGCSDLTSVTIPSSLTSIGWHAFEGCSGLTKVIVPDIASWCNIIFSNSDSNPLSYAKHIYSDDNTEITDLAIPDGVTSIGFSAFTGCTSLTSVAISEGVTSIGSIAFRDCISLTCVTIPSSMTSISNSAFLNCSSLTSVTINSNAIMSSASLSSNLKNIFGEQVKSYVIGEGVTSIGFNAFYGCFNLTSVTIPSSVTSIGSSAFAYCTGLTSVTIPEGVTSIGDDAFKNCTGLRSVTLPEGVTSIGKSAFSVCTGLMSVTIPSSVTSIGKSAFEGCTSLTKVIVPDIAAWCNISFGSIYANPLYYAEHIYSDKNTEITDLLIPEGVTSICVNLFRNCSDLKSVTIPSSVTSFDESAFTGCSKLTIVTINCDAIMSKKYSSSSNLKAIFGEQVKSYVIGEGVTSIGNYAFYGCSSLMSATISSSVTSIGEYAFYNCSGLTGVTIPEGVTSIGSDAFKGCSGLTGVTIPSSVSSIGEGAFSGCTGLRSVTISEGVMSIGSYAFSGCTGLTSVTISEGVTSIGEHAFYNCTGLEYVTIPDGVTSIGQWAFSGCSRLMGVTIPEGVTSIGQGAFYGTWLFNVSIPSSVTSIGKSAFSGCKVLTSVTINSNAIMSNTYLTTSPSTNLTDIFGSQVTSYVIGEGVTSIGKYAFAYCTGLTSVTIHSSVTSISEYAFLNCSGLTKVIVPDISAWCNILFEDTYANPLHYARHLYSDENAEITDLVIPDGVTSIGKYAFAYCTGLTSVTIPSSVTSIGRVAFSDCTGLTKVKVSDIAAWCNISFGDSYANPLYYAHHLYSDENTEITDLVIPEGVTSIGERAFLDCTGLTGVTIPSSVTSIGSSAFHDCTSLISVTIPESVTIIGEDAFYNTPFYNKQPNGLVYLGRVAYKYKGTIPAGTEIVIADGTVSISPSAFYQCKGLTSVTIPSSVTSIGSSAFYQCSGLTTVYCYVPTPPSISSTTFTNRANATLYVPYGSKSAYQNATCWMEFLNIIEIEPEWYFDVAGSTATILGSSQSSGDLVIPSVVYKNGTAYPVTSIGAGAFNGCMGLTSITIPQSVTSIDASAFSGCTGLATVKVTVTDRASFCTNTLLGQIKSILDKPVTLIDSSGNEITEYVIPDGVTKIGSSAFANCTDLASITIPQSVTSVDASAFSGCTGLATVKVTVTDRASFCTNTLLGQIKSIFDKPVTLIDGIGNEISEFVIPAGVIKIGSSAFVNCTGLTGVIIPEGVKSISGSAFRNCSSLTSVTIPEGLTSIGSSVFYNCTSLENVSIPSTVTNIGGWAFSGCTGLTTVYCYVPTPLTIESSTFSNNANATLYVPFGSKTAYQNANYWNGFKEIIEIEPDSYDNWYFDIAGSTATILGTQQPTGDLVIPSIVYKNGTAYPVTSIGAGAFNGCTGLTSITIPQSVTNIDASAFDGCTNLTGVKVIVTDFATFCTNTLLGQIKSILDKPVTLIDGSGNEITEYVIPFGVKTMGANAFANCTGLTSVIFPQSVTSIDASAFTGCTALTGVKVVVTDFAAFCTNEVLGLIKSVLNKPVTLTRSNGTEITEYTIPVGVTKIDDSAFANCTGLTSITIPQSVTSLITSAFSGCTGLTGVKVVVTDMATFCTNTLLSKIKPAINQPVTLINNNGSVITEYVIPESVTSIGSSAFVNCTGLTSVTIPESVTNIGSGAFNGCTNLTTVYCYVPTPLSIGSTTFSNRANATLYVPYGSKSAYQKANYWKEFREIIEMDRVLTDSFVIGDFAFNNYNNLSVVEVSSSNKNMTLADLGDITTVSHNGKTYTVTEISANAFKDCKQLVAVYLPDNNIRINAGAFKGCDNLKRIVFEGSTPPSFVTDAAEDAFDESHFNNVTLEVWRDKAAYTAHPQWKKFNTCIVRLLTGTKIKGAATVNNTSVDMNCRLFSGTNLLVQTGYYTPDDPNWSVKAISNINSGVLRIPETIRYNNKDYSVTLLGACSFGGVNTSGQGMGKVVIPNSVYCIDAECFANCRSLKEVIIGDGLTVVGNHVFYNCTSLKDIYVYATVPPGIRTDVASTVFSGVPSNCVLHVPEGSVNAYKNAVGWSRFNSIVKIKPGDETTGIEDIDASTDFDNEIEVYDLNGQRQPALRRGINIIRMKDGSTKKVLVK